MVDQTCRGTTLQFSNDRVFYAFQMKESESKPLKSKREENDFHDEATSVVEMSTSTLKEKDSKSRYASYRPKSILHSATDRNNKLPATKKSKVDFAVANNDSDESSSEEDTKRGSYKCFFTRFLENFIEKIWDAETLLLLKEEAAQAEIDKAEKKQNKLESIKIRGSNIDDDTASARPEMIKKPNNRQSISLFPLRFVSDAVEKQYTFNQNRSFKYRNIIAGFFALILIFVALFTVLSTRNGHIYLQNDIVFILFVTYLSLALVVAFVYMLAYKLPWVRDRLEMACYAMLCSTIAIQSILAFIFKFVLYSRESYIKQAPALYETFGISFKPEYIPENLHEDPMYHLMVVANELFIGMWNQGTVMFAFIVFNCVSPQRLCITAWLQGLITLLNACNFLYGAFQLRETVGPGLLNVWATILVYLATMVGAYAPEVQRRGMFFEWIEMRRKVNRLVRQKKRAQRKAGSTSGLDDIRAHCIAIRSTLMEAKSQAGRYDITVQITHALSLVEECLDIFATSKNLYLTEINDDIKDESFIRILDMAVGAKKNVLAAESALSSHMRSRQETLNALRPKHAGFNWSPTATGSKDISRDVQRPQHVRKQAMELIFYLHKFDRFSGGIKQAPSTAIFELGYTLMSRVTMDWGCEDVVLRNFLANVQDTYQEQPYHNQKHGAMVAHMMCILCKNIGVFREMNSLGVGTCMVAALCHDLGHPGRNNNFFVAQTAPLSIIYNDRSVLENFHSASTFSLVADPDCNIFAYFTDVELRGVRANIIDLILATDMKSHFDFLNKFRTIRTSSNFDWRKSQDNKWLIAEMCMRASDLGHSMVSWGQHFEWSGLVTQEFYLQGDEEKRLNIAVSPLCDRGTHPDMAKSQVGFLRHVVKPLIAELAEVDVHGRICPETIRALEANIRNWEVLQERGEVVTLPLSAIQYEQKLQGIDHTIALGLLRGAATSTPEESPGGFSHSRTKSHGRDLATIVEGNGKVIEPAVDEGGEIEPPVAGRVPSLDEADEKTSPMGETEDKLKRDDTFDVSVISSEENLPKVNPDIVVTKVSSDSTSPISAISSL